MIDRQESSGFDLEGEVMPTGQAVKPVLAGPKTSETTVSVSTAMAQVSEKEVGKENEDGDVDSGAAVLAPSMNNKLLPIEPDAEHKAEAEMEWGEMESCVEDKNNYIKEDRNELITMEASSGNEEHPQTIIRHLPLTSELQEGMTCLAAHSANPDAREAASKESYLAGIVKEELSEKLHEVNKRPPSPPPPPPPPKDKLYLDTTSSAHTESLSEGNEYGPSRNGRRDSSSEDEDTKSEIHSIIDQFEAANNGDNSESTSASYETPLSPILMPRTNSLSVLPPRHPPRSSSLEALKEVTVGFSRAESSTSVNNARSPVRSPMESPQPQTFSSHSQRSALSPALRPQTPPQASRESPEPATQMTLHQPPPPEPEPDLPFDFHRFLEQLRHRTADPVAKYLRSFLYEFSKKQWTVREQVKIIRDFLHFIVGKMAQCEVWRDVSDQEFDNAKEGMEKLVMNRLYNQTFSPLIPPAPPSPPGNRRRRANDPERERGRRGQHQEDVERDEILAQKVKIYGWIKEEHLDIASVGESGKRFLLLAIQELDKIKMYRAPRDKVICVLNCCKVLFGLLRHSGSEESADGFIPLLIFVVLRTNPEHLVSNVQYILRFRNPEKLGGEAGYYLSSLMGAIQFIETLDRSSLTISGEEFEKNVEAAVAAIAEKPPTLSQEQRLLNGGDEISEKSLPPTHNGLNSKAGGSASGSLRAERHPHLLDGGSTSSRLRSASPAPAVNMASAEATKITPRTSLDYQQHHQLQHQNSYSTITNGNNNHEDSTAANLLRTIQKPLVIASSLFSSGSDEKALQHPPPSPKGQDRISIEQERRREGITRYESEEAVAKQASAETAEALMIQRAEHENVVGILVGMFPGLDREVINDVVREKHGRVELAVDACLALSNG